MRKTEHSFVVKASEALEYESNYYIALLEHNSFRSFKLTFHIPPYEENDKTFLINHREGVFYLPPYASGTTLEDIEGATYAHDDGTHWHFMHESPGQRHEAEAYAQAKLIAHFQPLINKQGALVHAAPDITQRTQTHNVLLALNTFVDEAMIEVEKQLRVLPLGHFERNTPHLDNHRALIVSAVEATYTKWQTKALSDTAARHNVNRVQNAVASFLSNLRETPRILTRAQDHEAAKPKVSTQISAVTMVANGAVNSIDLSSKFTARDSLTYTAESSDTAVATVNVSHVMLTITALKAGSATITVRATAPDKRYAEQTFSVSVVAQ